jgi:hypothetical protein
MTETWQASEPQSAYCKFKKISTSEDWFEVYEIAPIFLCSTSLVTTRAPSSI